eukprot:6204981-Pleurochrysis_carterae.AAC.1
MGKHFSVKAFKCFNVSRKVSIGGPLACSKALLQRLAQLEGKAPRSSGWRIARLLKPLMNSSGVIFPLPFRSNWARKICDSHAYRRSIALAKAVLFRGLVDQREAPFVCSPEETPLWQCRPSTLLGHVNGRTNIPACRADCSVGFKEQIAFKIHMLGRNIARAKYVRPIVPEHTKLHSV